MKTKVVTNKVKYTIMSGFIDVDKCVCGANIDIGEFFIYEGKDRLSKCPKCGRKMYYEVKSVVIYEVE